MGRMRHLLIGTGLVGSLFLGASSVDYYDGALPSTMNPIFARTMVDFRSHEMIFDRLYTRSPITNELESRVVESDEVINHGEMLKVTLKKGIKWHDGKPLTAKDLCFTVKALLDPKTPSSYAKPYRESIKTCTVQDKMTAVIAFHKLYPSPRERASFPIVPSHSFSGVTAMKPDNAFSTTPNGTGPFKAVKTRRVVNFEAVKNAHHDPKIGVFKMSEGGDPFVQVRTIINAGVHGIIQVGPALRPEVAASDDVALKSYDLRSWWFMAVNTSSGAFAHQKVREALHLTLDRNELRELTIGVDPNDKNPPCEFISGPFVQSSPYYNRSVPLQETHNRDRAKALLAEAGAKETSGRWMMNGSPITVRLGMNSSLDAEAKDLLNQLGNQFGTVGLDRQVHMISPDEWNRKVVTGEASSEFDLALGKWSFGVVEDVTSIFHTRQGGKGALNIFNYTDPEVDKLLMRFEDARTDTEARDAYHDLHATVAKKLPYIFLWKLDTKSAWRMEIKGNTIAPYFYFTSVDGWSN